MTKKIWPQVTSRRVAQHLHCLSPSGNSWMRLNCLGDTQIFNCTVGHLCLECVYKVKQKDGSTLVKMVWILASSRNIDILIWLVDSMTSWSIWLVDTMTTCQHNHVCKVCTFKSTWQKRVRNFVGIVCFMCKPNKCVIYMWWAG